MKTPMQILLEKIENGDFLHPKVIGEFIKYNLIKKEKEHCKFFAFKFRNEQHPLYNSEKTLKYIEELYDKTFNTKEK